MWPGSMSAPWQVYAGDDATLSVTITEAGQPAALPVEGWACHWRYSPSSAEHVVIDVDTTDAATGTLTLRLTGEQTAAMRSDGVFDLRHLDGDVERTYVRGTTQWMKDVTR